MVKISNSEAEILNKKYNVNYGENGISIHGKFKKSKNKSHYLCERHLEILEKIRSGKE